jgi:hypothetical protein
VLTRNAGVGLAAAASFDLQPAVAAVRHCAISGGCADLPYPSIRIDRASASARSASRVAFLAASPMRDEVRRRLI